MVNLSKINWIFLCFFDYVHQKYTDLEPRVQIASVLYMVMSVYFDAVLTCAYYSYRPVRKTANIKLTHQGSERTKNRKHLYNSLLDALGVIYHSEYR